MPTKRKKRMSTILNEARELGAALVDPRETARVQLALRVAHAVVAGEVGPDDAEEIYVSYYDAAMNRTKGQPPTSHKVQVSKLRQVMKLADERPDGLALLERVLKLHGDFQGQPKPLFEAMVAVARAQRRQVRALTNSELIEILRKP
jgi:hypothetical protein